MLYLFRPDEFSQVCPAQAPVPVIRDMSAVHDLKKQEINTFIEDNVTCKNKLR